MTDEYMLSDVRALACDIGPRGTGTPGEAAAADFVSSRLSSIGRTIERHSFAAVASQNAFPLAVDILSLAAVALYPLGGTIGRWIAAALALSSAPLLAYTIRNSTSPLSLVLPRVRSQSVVSRIGARDEARQHVVILAHLDTNRPRVAWQSQMRRTIEPMTLVTLGMLASIGVLYLIGALLGGLGWVWWLSLLPAAYVVGTVGTLVKEDRAPFTCGASDNAASVAVALDLARRLGTDPLKNTEVWMAFTGAEESDHAGLRALLSRHREVLRAADFIGLEGLGGGDLVYLTRQGVVLHYYPDPSLLALAEKVASEHQALAVTPAEMTMTDEVGTLRRAGYRAICIAGRDPATGTIPHWHRLDDTADTVSEEAMAKASDFVYAMLQELDRRAVA